MNEKGNWLKLIVVFDTADYALSDKPVWVNMETVSTVQLRHPNNSNLITFQNGRQLSVRDDLQRSDMGLWTIKREGERAISEQE